MSRSLFIKNRQRTIPVNTRHARRLTLDLLRELLALDQFDLGICLVDATEMARLNETFLRHQGSTDVITFDYSSEGSGLHGEIFICLDEAIAHARRFRTTWPSELVRYIVHGILHLLGHDDSKPAARRKMKREENRLLQQLEGRWPLTKLLGARRRPMRQSSIVNRKSRRARP